MKFYFHLTFLLLSFFISAGALMGADDEELNPPHELTQKSQRSAALNLLQVEHQELSDAYKRLKLENDLEGIETILPLLFDNRLKLYKLLTTQYGFSEMYCHLLLLEFLCQTHEIIHDFYFYFHKSKGEEYNIFKVIFRNFRKGVNFDALSDLPFFKIILHVFVCNGILTNEAIKNLTVFLQSHNHKGRSLLELLAAVRDARSKWRTATGIEASEACRSGQLLSVFCLLENKDHIAFLVPSATPEERMMPLHNVAWEGYAKIFEVILNRCITHEWPLESLLNALRTKNFYHYTPLHYAAYANFSNIFQVLFHAVEAHHLPLEFIYDLLAETDEDGLTPLALARKRNCHKTAELIVNWIRLNPLPLIIEPTQCKLFETKIEKEDEDPDNPEGEGAKKEPTITITIPPTGNASSLTPNGNHTESTNQTSTQSHQSLATRIIWYQGSLGDAIV